MTTTDQTAPTDDVAPALEARASAIDAALESAGPQLDPFLAARAAEDLAAVRQRLTLGVDHTVVALVGGTGSGKSSMFNAITGLTFADVGALRPTTDEAAACTWGSYAEALLDHLEVAPLRRIRRETLHGDPVGLDGMVLLDLPDHDSVATHHAAQVDRLLPLVDVLVWVVDPQKYADASLHQRYLQAMRSRRENMLVLVNQIDTVPPAAVDRLVADVRELLAADGLDGVAVLTTSALTGTGIEEVRRHLAGVVSQPSVGARTAAAEMDAVAQRLAPAVGAGETPISADAVAATAAELLRTAGADAVADSVRTGLSGADGATVGRPEPPALPAVAAARDAWLARYQHGLPTRWADAVADAVTAPADLATAVERAVAGVPVPARGTRGRAFLLGGVVLAVVSLGYLVLALVAGVSWWPDATLSGAGLVAAAVLLARVGPVRRAEATELADRYREQVDERVVALVGEHLVAPTAQVLDRHQRLREALGR